LEVAGVTPNRALRFVRKELLIEGGRRLYLYEFDESPEGTEAEEEPASTDGKLEPEAGG
jgi:hypothetical protein